MNILELCLSDGRGGLEFYVADTARTLIDSGFNCYCVVAPGTPLAGILRDKQLSFTTVDRRVRDIPLLAALKLAAFINTNAIDLIHINWGHDLPLAVLAKRLSRRPVKLVYSRHMAWVKAKQDFYHRWLYQHVDRLLTITQQLKEQAQRFLPVEPHRLQVCYLGRPPCPPFEPAHCEGLFTGLDSSFNVGLVGRIEHKKGQHVLLEAIAKLQREEAPIGALIIGHAMDSDYLQGLKRQVAEQGLEQRVRFIDFVPDPMAILPCMDALVLTTYQETFGLVLVEAMHCGVAVIGTRAGGVTEIIDEGENGLLFEPGDASELAACLQRYYREPDLRAELARQGQQKACEQFSMEHHYAALQQHFEATLKGDT